MKTVYVLLGWLDYEGSTLLGVFSSLRAAREAKKIGSGSYDRKEIVRCQIDKIIQS